MSLRVNGRVVSEDRWPEQIGLVSPYFQLYEEFTAKENLDLALALRGAKADDSRADELLEEVALLHRAKDPVRTFSSGMKQRVKLAFALMDQPAILFLDEPMTNLDTDGIALVRRVMRRQREFGVLIVATNDMSDVDEYEIKVDLNGTQ